MLDTANSVDGHMSNFRRKLENIGAGMEPTDSQHIGKTSKSLVRQRSADALSSPSGQLRERTAPLHRKIEAVLGLPSAIRTRGDSQDWLGRFLGGEVAGPLGQSLRAALEELGSFQPRLCTDLVLGAERTLRAMLVRFAPFYAAKVGQP
jgi:hypothetical protein